MENRKPLSELTGEELSWVWERNYKLQEEVTSCMEDNIISYIDDYMSVLKNGLQHWSIGFCNYNTIDIKSDISFLDACYELQKNFCLLCEDYDKVIARGKQIYTQLDCAETDVEYDELEEEMGQCVNTLHDAVLDAINKEIKYADKEESAFEYFFEVWLNDYADDGYFIDDDYELFLTTLKTKSFK